MTPRESITSARGEPWLTARAAATPTALALECGALRLSWAELAQRVAQAETVLRAAGLGAGDRVALKLPPGVDFVVALHALWRIGACVIPVNLRLPAIEAQRQLARVAARAIVRAPLAESPPEFVPGGMLSHPAHPFDRPERLSELLPPAPSVQDVQAGDTGRAVALMLFTSGTTGAPKAACLRFSNLEWSARASAQHLGTGVADRWLACLPFFHIGGLSILVRAVLDGSSVVVHERFDVGRVSRALDASGITRMSLVPTTLERLLDLRQDRPPEASLETVLLGGGAASVALLHRARVAGFPVLPSYGLTESASQIATARLDDALDGRVGRALPGSEIRVVGPDGAPVAKNGVEGEIQVRGPTVFAGYFGDTAATRAAFDQGWLRTGDFGQLADDGRLRVLDRRSDLIVSGGENIYPAVVEAALLEHEDVAEAAVWRRADADLGQRVVAWVVPRAGAGATATALQQHCRARLADYQVPREVVFTQSLPRNALGKLMRSQLDRAARGALSPSPTLRTLSPNPSPGGRGG